ncbi:Dual specificity protein phosphatase 4 [Oopsacas minuta]|uniref:protein-tyrosine-phosphatase n=1 Tax=Oopsacas minuta TaxID=111878 RepID=A0AAV7JGV5_9METZ|nr:Dual specificity protein phosphatase 4 [Oopsacas minuta]
MLRRRMRPMHLTLSMPSTPTQTSVDYNKEYSAKRSHSFNVEIPVNNQTFDFECRDRYDSIQYDRTVGPAQILPFLYLGSEYHATNIEWLNKYGIEAILNVSNRYPDIDESQYEYKHLPVRDTGDSDITCIFQESFAFINNVRESGRKLLVHCQAGISRSATICIAYLMLTEGRSMDGALEYVRSCRKWVSPNFGFMGQLFEYEAELKSKPLSLSLSTKIDETTLEMIDENYSDSDSTNLSVWSGSESNDTDPSFMFSPTSQKSEDRSFFTISSSQCESSVLSSPSSTLESSTKRHRKLRKTFMHRPKWLKRASRSFFRLLQFNF